MWSRVQGGLLPARHMQEAVSQSLSIPLLGPKCRRFEYEFAFERSWPAVLVTPLAKQSSCQPAVPSSGWIAISWWPHWTVSGSRESSRMSRRAERSTSGRSMRSGGVSSSHSSVPAASKMHVSCGTRGSAQANCEHWWSEGRLIGSAANCHDCPCMLRTKKGSQISLHTLA